MAEPIRVLCVFSTLDRGGAESMCMNLYRNIDRNKVQFDFIKHTSDRGAFEEEICSLGGRVFEAPRLKIGNILMYRLWWIKHLSLHPEHLIIHGHFFTISPIYFQIAKRYRRITIGHIHISKANNLKKAILSKFINVFTDYPLACSRVAGKWVYGDRPFTILNNAIDAEEFCGNTIVAKEVREEFCLGDCLVLGNISRFDLQKNPYGTLEIFQLVHRKRHNSKLLWVGDGLLRTEIENKAKEIGIYDDIIFTGVRSDVKRLLQAMDVFIFPSFYEGLGIAAIEAQAAGVRTFCSDAVPQEAAITNLCKFLPLNDLQLWANEICKEQAGYEHPLMTEQIVKAGYDIHDTAKWLQAFYLSIKEKYDEQ